MKYSIIVPVYNVEKYIRMCLESIYKQTYSNYEVIIVNDGSKDKSKVIIDEYVKKDNRFKSYIKDNGGLSDARNYGLKYVTGDYILFVDSDDYIDINLLKELSNCAKYDMIKFKTNIVDDNYKLIRKEKTLCNSKEVSCIDLFNIEFCEPAWTYAYKTSFFKNNNFLYAKGKIHEDFGLTPLCLLKAKKIYYLNYYGYNYVIRKEGIIKSSNIKKRIEDMLYHFDYLINEIDKLGSIEENTLINFKHFLANRLIYMLKLLNKKTIKDYIYELNKRNIKSIILENTYKRKIKKIIFSNFPLLYSKILKLNKKSC